MKIHIIAVGRLRKGPERELFMRYQERVKSLVSVSEIEDRGLSGRNDPALVKRFREVMARDRDRYVIALDEAGKTPTSPAFAEILGRHSDSAVIQVLIGGADGLPNDIRASSHNVIAFGAMTWPHMLARAMVMEQIYRAHTILMKHPYHRH
ncbi:MAG: 23S rRNA (pseudouridine(1915)-N(3))-methyltransferase RlmH [Pseudomonadota bacterium]